MPPHRMPSARRSSRSARPGGTIPRRSGLRGASWWRSPPRRSTPPCRNASRARAPTSNGWWRSGRTTCASRPPPRCWSRRFAGSYEREAIRPHVLGRFEDMVLASAQHPAMLLYLDNFQSIGPNSRAAEIAAATPAGPRASTRTTRASCSSCTRSAWTAATRSRTSRSWRGC